MQESLLELKWVNYYCQSRNIAKSIDRDYYILWLFINIALMNPNIQIHNKKWTLTILTGVFDGIKLTTNDRFEYPIPSNYISKSMLIPGDQLKLTIHSDGSLVYKIIKLAPRKHIRGILHRKDNQYLALWSNNLNYRLNSAAVTFHKAQCWDEVCLVINEWSKYHHAALESIIKN